MKNFYITTAIDYVNDLPHIGHAYEKIAADVLARYWRAKDAQVLFQTGVDEHGIKVAQAAESAEKSPQEFTDEMAEKFKRTWQNLNISFDNFVRTTDPAHEKKVQEFLIKLKESGQIYKGKYTGFYCVGCEAYKSEDEMEAGYCPTHKKPCEKISEEVYFFKLAKYKPEIIKVIKSGHMQIEPESRKNEALNFLKDQKLSAQGGSALGRKDVAISRSRVKWGVPLPWDKSHTVYVWVDALFNYLTGSQNDQFWPANLHLIGKDILRFHSVIWPAILMALDSKLPKKIFVHGFLSVDGQKMSKSLGNVIDPNILKEKYGADAVRYFLLAEIPFGADGDFSIRRLEQRYNSDLANELGNLVMRILTLVGKSQITNHKFQTNSNVRNSKFQTKTIDKLIEELKFSEALTEIWKDIKSMNAEIDQKKLWELVKTDENKAKNLLKDYLARIAAVAENLSSFMPETTERIKKQLETGKAEVLFPKK